jgi:hypothetical protein
VFTDPAYGVRAGILLLRTYCFKHNLRTIAEILSRWAPASGTIGDIPGGPPNSPQEYSAFVSVRMRIGYNEKLELFNEDKSIRDISRLKGLFFAMAEFEIGNNFKVPEQEFNAGLELVQPGITNAGTRTSGARAAPEVNSHVGDLTLNLQISGSVGRRDKGAVNDKADVETVQQMLRHAAQILSDPRLDPGDTDGAIARDAAQSDTVRAIEAFQSRLFTRPDGVIDIGGRTWRELVRVLEGGGAGDDSAPGVKARGSFSFRWRKCPTKTGLTRRAATARTGVSAGRTRPAICTPLSGRPSMLSQTEW